MIQDFQKYSKRFRFYEWMPTTLPLGTKAERQGRKLPDVVQIR